MNTSPLLSVIIPVYNAANHLDTCISCLKKQGVSDLEVILVNDGSRDNSLEICHRYAAQDARIQVFDKPNGGQSSARSLALQHVRGRYIAFLDSDDSLADGTLAYARGQQLSWRICDKVFRRELLEAILSNDIRLPRRLKCLEMKLTAI